MAEPFASQEKNRQAYHNLPKKVKFPDLCQYAANGRGRGELRDGSMMTLTTNSAKIFSEDWASKSLLLEILVVGT